MLNVSTQKKNIHKSEKISNVSSGRENFCSALGQYMAKSATGFA